MRELYKPSKKLQKQLDKIEAQPIVLGQRVGVDLIHFNSLTRSTETVTCEVIEIKGDKYKLKSESYNYSPIFLPRDKIHVLKHTVGANPFPAGADKIRSVAFTLESLIFNLSILEDKRNHDPIIMNGIQVKELNWNPYVWVKGKKEYFQRPFVWELEDKQLLIESIYNHIDCGKILVRKRSYQSLVEAAKRGETELFFNDLIDGKQRLSAIKEFLLGEFKDLHGNYYGDLCWSAKRKVIDHQLMSYSEMPETCTDKEVLSQFLKLNFAGKPQSKEHLDFVRKLHEKTV